MPDEAKKLQATRILLTAAAVVILVTGLKLGQSFFVPVLLAGFIATVSFPITSWLRKRRVPMPIAVLLTVLVDFAFMTGVVIIVITLTGDLESKWQDRYYPAMNSKIDEVRETAVGVLENLSIITPRSKSLLRLEKISTRLILVKMSQCGFSVFLDLPF